MDEPQVRQPTYWQRTDHIVGPAHAAEFDRIGQQATRAAFEDFILEASQCETALLDAGCNTGVEGFRLFQRGFVGRYIGVDSNRKALEIARTNLAGERAQFLLSDLARLALAPRAFDVVLVKDVIEHTLDYAAILTELARVSRRWVVLSMFIRPRARRTAIKRHRDGYYLNRYRRSDLLEVMDAAGFPVSRSLFVRKDDEVFVFERND